MGTTEETLNSAEVAAAIRMANESNADMMNARMLEFAQILRAEAVSIAPSYQMSTHTASNLGGSAKPAPLIGESIKRIRCLIVPISDQIVISTDPGGASRCTLERYQGYRFDTMAALWLVSGEASVVEEFRK